MAKWIIIAIIGVIFFGCKKNKIIHNNEKELDPIAWHQENYRPQYHFSPKEKWMNDPNGLVYHKGVYHLFYQYYPEEIVWGPMHWGHATSSDLMHWKHKPIALYPDSHGLIFSGSAVVDTQNSSGFGTIDNPPLVAIYTYHLMEGEQTGRTDFQTQGIAYSLDNGEHWTKYIDNPVIKNEGVKDFRDPKVFWHEKTNSWILTLVAGDHAQIYRSKNLVDWEYLSDFGKEQGAHGGVWECPDLFQLKVEGTDETKWVLLISINPGAPNGGSGTQYFVGDFDGTSFVSDQKEPKWLDWGTDNYAGVTYNNLPDTDRVFIGWMSNWDYARDTPTKSWRSAMTLPRNLTLSKNNNEYALLNYPVLEIEKLLETKKKNVVRLAPKLKMTLPSDDISQGELRFKTSSTNFTIVLKNSLGEKLSLLCDVTEGKFTLDRSASGETDFNEAFGNKVHYMPINNFGDKAFEVRIFIDWSSIEVFLNKGQYVMTDLIFPKEPYNTIEITNKSEQEMVLKDFEIAKVKSIWKP